MSLHFNIGDPVRIPYLPAAGHHSVTRLLTLAMKVGGSGQLERVNGPLIGRGGVPRRGNAPRG